MVGEMCSVNEIKDRFVSVQGQERRGWKKVESVLVVVHMTENQGECA